MPKKTPLELINEILGQAVPGIGAAMAAIELIKEMFRRKQAGEPEMTLEQQADFLVLHGAGLQAFSNTWLADHGYDASGHRPTT